MTEANLVGIVRTIAPGILTYNSIEKARAFTRNGKAQGDPKYEATIMFPKDSPALAAIKTAGAQVAKAKWPGRSLKDVATPWYDGTTYADKSAAKQEAAGKDPKGFDEAGRDHVLITARSKFQPRLAGLDNGRIVDYDTETAKQANYRNFYAGVEVLVEINLVAYDPIKDGDKAGITAYLNGVVTLKKGDKLGGGASMAESFSGYAGAMSDADPTAGAEAW